MRSEAILNTKRTAWRNFRAGLAFIATLVLSILAVPIASADGGREIQIQDKCNPATFNAVLGPGACVGNGDVTFDEFLQKLNPNDGGHHAWHFSRATLGIKVGEVVSVRNVGGETHSFTEVVAFGATPIPQAAILNLALPPGTPFAIPAEDPGLTFLPPGASRTLSNLSPGTHMFQCFIHPWMRSVIQVASH
jgi:plastocyanin